jgi:hypothetical protein
VVFIFAISKLPEPGINGVALGEQDAHGLRLKFGGLL